MIARTYRITDRLGVALLKLLAMVVDSAARGVQIIVNALWRVLMMIFGVIIALVRLAIGATRSTGSRLASNKKARGAGVGATGGMARRAAREEMEVGLAEDPLRVQNRVLSVLLVGVLATLIGVVWWATENRQQTEPLPVAANVNALNGAASAADDAPAFAPTPGGEGVNLLAASTPVPTTTPLPPVLEARGSLAYVVREGGQTDVWVVDVSNRAPFRLTTSLADDRDPVWSPDGQRVAYASREDGNWEVYVYDLLTSNITRLTYDLSFQAGPVWSPDGQFLAYESYQGNNLDIYVVPVDGSQPPQRVTDNPAPDFSPAWSPDGRRLAFSSWRNGNQDIYIFSLDNPTDTASLNVTNTISRNEDYPAWSPNGDLLAFSALDEGLEKTFVKPAADPLAQPQVIGRGRQPAWSPDGSGLVVAVDSSDSTHLVAMPFTEAGVSTEVIPVPLGSSSPSWTAAPVPPALARTLAQSNQVTFSPLFVEQEVRMEVPPPFRLSPLGDVDAPNPFLSDRVNDSFETLRGTTVEAVGWDFLGQLDEAFWRIDRLPQPGEQRRNWHMTGRAFAFNRSATAGFPAPVEVVREDIGVETYWRVYVRVSEEAQDGQLGEPLRRMPWDFASRTQGDVEAYDQGGRVRTEMPEGYYLDFTVLANDYGWSRVPAATDWRANLGSANYWEFQKREGLDWLNAMLELYTEPQLGGFAPNASPAPTLPPPQPQQEFIDATIQALQNPNTPTPEGPTPTFTPFAEEAQP